MVSSVLANREKFKTANGKVGCVPRVEPAIIERAEGAHPVMQPRQQERQEPSLFIAVYDLLCLLIHSGTLIHTTANSPRSDFCHIPIFHSKAAESDVYIVPCLREHIHITAIMTVQLIPPYSGL